MAIGSLSLVNQKLAFARVLLKSITEVPPANHGERLRQQALLDSVVFQLVCGYQHYLRELAENYRVKDAAAIHTELNLLNALGKLGKTPGEASELQLLRQQQDTWLAQMHSCYESLWLPPPPELKPPKSFPVRDELIYVASVDLASASPERLNVAQVAEWESEFSALVARQRETSCEY